MVREKNFTSSNIFIKAAYFLLIAALYIRLLYTELTANYSPFYAVTSVILVLVILDILYQKKINLCVPGFLKGLFLFLPYVFLVSFFIREKDDRIFFEIGKLFLNSAYCLCAFHVIRQIKQTRWLRYHFIAIAIFGAGKVILDGYAVEAGRLSMGPYNNSNNLGVVIIIGIFFLIEKREELEKFFTLKMACILVMLYGIVLTGSRKSLLVGVALFVFWIVSYIMSIKSCLTGKHLVNILLVIAVTAAALEYLSHSFLSTSVFERLRYLFTKEGSKIRLDLYAYAVDAWKEHKLFGVGYRQFTHYNAYRLMTHSTYMEILSCTGLVGCILFFTPIIGMLYDNIKFLFCRELKAQRYDILMLLIMFGVELVLGLGQVWIYDFAHFIVLFYISYRLFQIKQENLRRDFKP